jgi:hypothetical protein
MIHKKIELREIRDFGQKFDAVFTFVRTNFKSFFKVIGLTVGPLALIGSFFFGLVYSNLFNITSLAATGNSMDVMSWIGNLIISYFFLGAASLWMMIAVFSFLAEYDRGNENITIEAIWKRGKSKILPTFVFGILTILAMILFVAIVVVIPGNNALGISLKVLIIIVGVFYVMFTLMLVVPNMVIEDAGLFGSIGRSFSLIRGNWWSTFGLFIVMNLVSSVATVVFAIPLYAAMIAKFVMHMSGGEIFTVIGSCIYFLGMFLMTTLPTLAIGIQYFYLVERKDGTGLLKKIDQLGQSDPVENEGEF